MISILVPIYKVEQYLQRCIDSVLAQDFKDWELILVDDGSPDRSGEICDSLTPNPSLGGEGRIMVSSDGKIKTIHKKNGGLPSARLAGLKEAKGEYLIFLDADDWLLPGALNTLYEAIRSDGGYDIVRSVVKRVSEDGQVWLEHYEIEEGTIDGENNYAAVMRSDRMCPYLHNAIYRADLFNENTFLPIINNGISVGEDWFANYAISPRVRRLKFIVIPTFAYFVNGKSMMGETIYGWNYLKKLQNCSRQINATIGFVEDNHARANTALGNLKYFFVPEIPFRWDLFKELQPWIIRGIEQNEKWYNRHYGRFIRFGWLFFLYANFYKLFFFIFKLKGKRRRVLD